MAIIMLIMLSVQSCLVKPNNNFIPIGKEVKCYSGGKVIYSTSEAIEGNGLLTSSGAFEIVTPTEYVLSNADCIMISHHKKGE